LLKQENKGNEAKSSARMSGRAFLLRIQQKTKFSDCQENKED